MMLGFDSSLAGLGVLLAGAGSLMSGYAALKVARKNGKKEANGEAPVQGDSPPG